MLTESINKTVVISMKKYYLLRKVTVNETSKQHEVDYTKISVTIKKHETNKEHSKSCCYRNICKV